MRWTYAAVTLGAVLMAGGCGDDGGPGGGGDLSDSEKTALIAALTNASLEGGFGGLAAFAVLEIGEVGKLNPAASQAVARAVDEAVRLSASGIAATEYDAVGFAVDYVYDIGGQSYEGWFVGVVGWNGITGNTVNELVVVYGIGIEGSPQGSVSGSIEDFDAYAGYETGGVYYYGTTGDVNITSSGFGGTSRNCSSEVEGFTFECTIRLGTMSGNFEFVASRLTGTGTYTQAPVDFTGLPALRMSITYSDQ
jgi:hypothetical protein